MSRVHRISRSLAVATTALVLVVGAAFASGGALHRAPVNAPLQPAAGADDGQLDAVEVEIDSPAAGADVEDVEDTADANDQGENEDAADNADNGDEEDVEDAADANHQGDDDDAADNSDSGDHGDVEEHDGDSGGDEGD